MTDVDTFSVDVSDMSNAPNVTLVALVAMVDVSDTAKAAEAYLTPDTDMVLVSLMLAAPVLMTLAILSGQHRQMR